METKSEEEAPQLGDLEFEGRQIIGIQTSITGSSQRITKPLQIGHKTVVVIELETMAVDHRDTADGLKRVQRHRITDLFELEGSEGRALLRKGKLREKKSQDRRTGRAALPGIDEAVSGVEVTVDGNGTLLTPEEIAEVRGERQIGRADEDGQAEVGLVFEDASRAAWPDDFVGTDWTTPKAGDKVTNPNRKDSTPLTVVQVLDMVSGDVIEEWTAADEEALSLEEERLAEKAEKPKRKSKSPKVIVDEITNAEPELPGDDA